MIFIPIQIIYEAQLLNLLHSVFATLIRMRPYDCDTYSNDTVRHLPHFQRRRDTIQALFLISLNKLSFYYPKSYNIKSLTPFRFYRFLLPFMCL